MEDASRSNLLTPLSFLDDSFLLLLFFLVWIVSNIHLACALLGLIRLDALRSHLLQRISTRASLFSVDRFCPFSSLALVSLCSSVVLYLSPSEVHQLRTVATARTGFTFTLPNCLSQASSAGLPIP